MAMSKEELLRAKMEKQKQGSASAFELGSKPLVNTREPEVVAAPVVAAPVAAAPIVVKERKGKRIQILTYESLVDRMDAYAERIGASRAEVFEAAVGAYLDQYDK